MSTNKAEREEEVGKGRRQEKEVYGFYSRRHYNLFFPRCLDVTPSGRMRAEHRRRDAHMPLIGLRSGVVGGILVRRKDGM